ncbi:hypothetical protein PVAND_014572 [Polypedilum vanderplanki]|uniref:Zinc finger protein n=1 Tax=Polypedilum vanderplanki TaxID=319348 RepID=A0A9J6BA20_POLVA|nr:hypothetical protein PVAND_014572 [Polypedilum vanderplanki]
MDLICRLCAKNSSTTTSVFSFNNNKLISDIMQIICPIKICPVDDFPKQICNKCLRILFEAYELRELSVKTDINFRTGNINLQKEKQQEPRINVKIEQHDIRNPVELFDESISEPELETFSEEEDELNEDEEDELDEIIPIEPQIKKQKIENDEKPRYSCKKCPKTFTFMSNLQRHESHKHNGIEIPYKVYPSKNPAKPKEIKSTNCPICNIFISHRTNLSRHIKMHHSGTKPRDYKRKLEEVKNIQEKANELTKQLLNSQRKQKYIQFISVVSSNEVVFTYECLLCKKKNGFSKLWKQKAQNGGISNIRRHLSTYHEFELNQVENSRCNDGN